MEKSKRMYAMIICLHVYPGFIFSKWWKMQTFHNCRQWNLIITFLTRLYRKTFCCRYLFKSVKHDWYSHSISSLDKYVIGKGSLSIGVGMFMVFSATFNNISVISWSFYWWRKPEYLEKTKTCRRSLTNFITLSFNEYTSPWAGFEFTMLVVIGTHCTGSCKSNYHTVTTMPVPTSLRRDVYLWYICIVEWQ